VVGNVELGRMDEWVGFYNARSASTWRLFPGDEARRRKGSGEGRDRGVSEEGPAIDTA
jgi:hypothetical protein